MTVSYITPEIQALVGVTGPVQTAPLPLGADTLRRFMQAVMDPNPVHYDEAAAKAAGFAGVVAPPLQPQHLFQRAPGSPDPFEKFKENADWDGMGGGGNTGLPKVELPLKRLLNGGYSCEFYQLAQVGDLISRQSRYKSITERESSSGPMVFINIETTYTNQNGATLMRVVQTTIAR
ncbi:MAG TPA: hypothetical protein DCM06_16880 [Comamonadaceae bacterium]|nr:hypothetical protein [Comamonadaceae bacterium]